MAKKDKTQVGEPNETEVDGAKAAGAETSSEDVTNAVEQAHSATTTDDDVLPEVKELREQLAAEKTGRRVAEQARLSAEVEAQKQREAASSSEGDVLTAQVTAVSRALEAAESQMNVLKGQYATAAAAGDWDKAAEIQAEMSEEGARKVTLTNGKKQLEQMVEARKSGDQQQTRQTGQQTRPPTFDEAVSRYTPRTQEWIKKHPEVLSDMRKMNFAQAAHFSALGAGHVTDTDAYFDHLDQVMGYKVATTTTRKPAPGAPPGRTGPGNGSVKELQVKDMTPRMHQLAKEADMKAEDWIQNYNKLLQDDPSFLPLH